MKMEAGTIQPSFGDIEERVYSGIQKKSVEWFHLKGMLFPGIVFALIPAALVGWLVTLVR